MRTCRRRATEEEHEMTTTSGALSLPLLECRPIITGENENDSDPLSTPPASSPSPPRGCCLGDESPRPGELEAIRSSSVQKKKPNAKKKPNEKKKAKLSLLARPPPTPLQDKNKNNEKKKKPPASSSSAANIPSDARPSLAAERERHRFDPRQPAPGWLPPPSPLSLIEEALYEKPWRLLVACCLLNKTTAAIARPCLRTFFEKYPDAAAAAAVKEEGDDGGEELEAIAALFRPCGCHRRRAAAVVRLSREFLLPTWRDPRELFGVGEYAADAYWIFVRGVWHCGAEGEGEEEQEEEGREKKKKKSGENTKKSSSRSFPSCSPPRRRSSFSWRPRDKDLAKYVEFLVETGGQGCGLEREEFC